MYPRLSYEQTVFKSAFLRNAACKNTLAHALLDIILELALVVSAVSPGVNAVAVTHIVFILTLVCVAVAEHVFSFTFLDVVNVISLVGGTVTRVNAVAVLPAFLKLALKARFVTVKKTSSTVTQTVFELSLVDIAVCIGKFSVSAYFIVVKLALINVAARISENAAAVTDAVFYLSLVDTSVRVFDFFAARKSSTRSVRV